MDWIGVTGPTLLSARSFEGRAAARNRKTENVMEDETAIVGDYLIRSGTSDDLLRLESLWLSLYEHQKSNGMLLDLPANAFTLWTASLAPILGRFACLFVAEKNEELFGFLAARIRSLPPYFGGAQAGFISDIYVAETDRGHGLGRKLVLMATDWFQKLGLTRIELQVIMNNTPARELYRQLGWAEELVQMVWEPGPGSPP
jgi:ribosomal protein S18 acetylase RimI-like enzyme